MTESPTPDEPTRPRTVLVTGSTRGIGLSLVRGFAWAGDDVIVNARSAEQVEAAVAALRDELAGTGRRVFGATFDVADAPAVTREIARLEAEAGPIDVLVNNAGIQRRAPLVDLTLQDWRAVVDTNLTGAFVVGQAVARGMLARGDGVIVNICSVQTSIVRRTTAPYAASKAGLAGLTRAMCAEWASAGLRVNGLAPGYLATDLNTTLMADPEFNGWITGRTPAGRWGDPDDVVGPVLWLCSPEARFVNGQIIYVDGGLTAVI